MINSIFKKLASNKNLNILIYHQVLPEFDPMRPDEITAQQFEQHLKYLSDFFSVLTLNDAVGHLKNDSLPDNAAVITFDDGYENNASVALPLLNKYQQKATFFIASDFLNGGIMWNDRVIEWLRCYKESSLTVDWLEIQKVPTSNWQEKQDCLKLLLQKLKYFSLDERLAKVAKLTEGVTFEDFNMMMTDQQVMELRNAGMEIGGHTCSHPILAVLEEDEAKEQIERNKHYLETLLDEPIFSFAYPNGKPGVDYHNLTAQLAKNAGYSAAVSTSWGVSDKYTDFYQLPRFTPWNNNKWKFLALMYKNRFNQPSFA